MNGHRLGQLLTGPLSINNGNSRLLRSLAKSRPCFALRCERRRGDGVEVLLRPSPHLLRPAHQGIRTLRMPVSEEIPHKSSENSTAGHYYMEARTTKEGT